MARLVTAVVLGGAEGVWHDLEEIGQLADLDLVIAVNSAIAAYSGHIDHACSFHADLLPWWRDKRRAAGRNDPGKYWTSVGQRPILGAAMGFVPAWGGSSGLIAAQVGMLVADQVILCGVPLDPSGEHFDKAGVWDEALKHRHAWMNHADELRGKVRSMSGWTSWLLGKPTREWISHIPT